MESVEDLKAKIHEAAEIMSTGEIKRTKEEALDQLRPLTDLRCGWKLTI
jgi:hypothetical protein